MGGAGHVAKAIGTCFSENESEVVILDKDRFDITNSLDYVKFNFRNSLIIDCIVKIDGTPEEVNRINYEAFKSFIDYLYTQYRGSFYYCYLSTYSTQDIDSRVKSDYVMSKYRAEVYLKRKISNFKIIRLSYPFGLGEKSNRLFSRLISSLIYNKEITISKVNLGIMPISLLKRDFIKLVKCNDSEINFIPNYEISLESIVYMIRSELAGDRSYVPELMVKESKFFSDNKDNYIEEVKKEIRLLINEIKR